MTELKDRIAQLRRQAGMTQEGLGEALGVSRQAVSKWEAGQANPDVDYLIKMCRIFGVSSDWLLLGAEEPAGLWKKTCPKCGEFLDPSAVYCHRCGGQVADEERYCLYLLSCWDNRRKLCRAMETLFAHSWAKPAFSWEEGTPVNRENADRILEQVPTVLCSGLTYDQAREGAALFADCHGAVGVYLQREMGADGRPAARQSAVNFKPRREPLSAGATYGLVLLALLTIPLLCVLIGLIL